MLTYLYEKREKKNEKKIHTTTQYFFFFNLNKIFVPWGNQIQIRLAVIPNNGFIKFTVFKYQLIK